MARTILVQMKKHVSGEDLKAEMLTLEPFIDDVKLWVENLDGKSVPSLASAVSRWSFIKKMRVRVDPFYKSLYVDRTERNEQFRFVATQLSDDSEIWLELTSTFSFSEYEISRATIVKGWDEIDALTLPFRENGWTVRLID